MAFLSVRNRDIEAERIKGTYSLVNRLLLMLHNKHLGCHKILKMAVVRTKNRAICNCRTLTCVCWLGSE